MRRIDALQAALNADLTAGSDIEEEDENFNDINHDISSNSKLMDEEQVNDALEQMSNVSPVLDFYNENKPKTNL